MCNPHQESSWTESMGILHVVTPGGLLMGSRHWEDPRLGIPWGTQLANRPLEILYGASRRTQADNLIRHNCHTECMDEKGRRINFA